MPPPEKPLPLPRPKTKPPKPRPKQPTGAKPMPARPPREPAERDGAPGGVPFLQQPFACETFRLCPPPPAPPATVHLRSGRLPTPLIVVSASLLGVTALLLLALLVRWLIRRRRRGQQRALQDEAPLAQEDDEESVDSTAGWGGGGEGQQEEVDSGDVHHVWFIRTKGLDERAIAAIAAVVYDSSAKSKRGGDDGGCAVCLAEFRDGETLRLLPRCGHAFHRACIDTWLRAHVNCPLCRAPVQPAAAKPNAAPGAATAATRSRGVEAEANHGALAGARTQEADRSVAQERAVRRAASMVTLPRRPWPADASPQAPASSSGREEDVTTGLAKIRRLLKFSDMAGVGAGRSASFGARSCQGLPTTTRSGPSTAAGVNRVIQLLEGGVMMN